MSKIDFDTINADALARCRDLLENLLPGGRVRGNEYVSASVHGGEGRSFSFNLESGRCSDFATEQSGGDLVSLVASIRGIGQGEAARELAEMTGTPLPQATPQSTTNRQKEKLAAIVPVPRLFQC